MMKHLILLCTYFLSLSAFAQFSVSGGSQTPYEYDVDATAKLDKVYIVNGISGATLSYTSDSGNMLFFKYKQRKEDKVQIPSSEITTSTSGGKTTYQISNIEDYTGYIAESSAGIISHHIWMIDYANHPFELNSIDLVEKTEPCSAAQLVIDKVDELIYYDINGVKHNVKRLYTLTYTTEEWKNNEYQTKVENSEGELGKNVYVTSPPALKDTDFTLKGDKIASHFRQERSITVSGYHATEVAATIRALQVDKDGNETEMETKDPLPAPLLINFYGHSSEAAYHYKWTVANDKNPENDLVRYQQDFSYEFTQAGKYTATLEVSNREYECPQISTFPFSISESKLEIPNYFSPGNSTDGKLKEFKVVYKSIIKFKCSIFNRWGNKVFEFTDPALGWDGKYKGDYVSPGVYFYVIEAEGSDGIKYKKGGDINILYKK